MTLKDYLEKNGVTEDRVVTHFAVFSDTTVASKPFIMIPYAPVVSGSGDRNVYQTKSAEKGKNEYDGMTNSITHNGLGQKLDKIKRPSPQGGGQVSLLSPEIWLVRRFSKCITARLSKQYGESRDRRFPNPYFHNFGKGELNDTFQYTYFSLTSGFVLQFLNGTVDDMAKANKKIRNHSLDVDPYYPYMSYIADYMEYERSENGRNSILHSIIFKPDHDVLKQLHKIRTETTQIVQEAKLNAKWPWQAANESFVAQYVLNDDGVLYGKIDRDASDIPCNGAHSLSGGSSTARSSYTVDAGVLALGVLICAVCSLAT